jgi:hypothetical protein
VEPPPFANPDVPPPAPVNGQAPLGGIAALSGLSNWIRYSRPDCCSPIGAHGPIETELFIRNGPTLPIGAGIFTHLLDTGWDVQGGGRSMFFNADLDAAWTAEAALGYTYNHGRPGRTVAIIPRVATARDRPTPAHVRVLHRTAFTLGGGKEYFLYVWPGDNGVRWRAGWDAGARLGTVRLDFEELVHRTDVMYGLTTAVHTDFEIPCRCVSFLLGLRLEWDYQWMSILQSQNHSNLMDANVLFNMGIRY